MPNKSGTLYYAPMELTQELLRYYRWLRQYGINDSHSGNASVRDDNDFWITPTGACADTLTAEQIVQCKLNGELGQQASQDAPLHLAVYQHNPKARAVLHSHGPHSLALTMNGEDFTPIDFEGSLYFTRVPVITIPYKEYFATAAQQVARVLAEHPIMVVRGHGVYTCAENLNLAYKWTCSLEHSAKIAYLEQTSGKS